MSNAVEILPETNEQDPVSLLELRVIEGLGETAVSEFRELFAEEVNVLDVREYLVDAGLSNEEECFVSRALDGSLFTLKELRETMWTITRLSDEEYTEFCEEIPLTCNSVIELLEIVGVAAKWRIVEIRSGTAYSLFVGNNTDKADEVDPREVREPVRTRRKGRKKSSTGTLIDESDNIGLYLNAMGQYKLLTKEQEVELSKRVIAGLDAAATLASAEAELSDEEHKKLTDLINDGKQAKQDFVLANLKLVVSIANRYIKGGVRQPVADLIQEGNMGLAHAVDKFDYRKGFKFSTYATFWIRQAIGRSIDHKGTLLNISGDIKQSIRAMRKVEKMLQDSGDDLTYENIASAMGCTPKKVRTLKEVARNGLEPVSLDAPVSSDSDSEYGDFIADPKSEQAFGNADSSYNFEQVNQALMEAIDSRLSEIEKQALLLRHGFDGEGQKSYREVGEILGGLSIEGARKAVRRAESKLATRNVRDLYEAIL